MNGVNYLVSALVFMGTCCKGFTAQDMHQYMWANYYQFQGNYATAGNWYDKLFSNNTPVHAYKGYLMFLYETGNFTKIVSLLPTIEASFEQDADVQLLLARSLDKVGKNKEADDKIIHLAAEFKAHPEIVFQAAHVYVQRKESENGIKTIDIFLNNSPRRNNNFIFYFMKSQIYVKLGDKEQALKNVKSCLDMHPGFGKGWLMLALLEEQQGRLDEAIKGYTTFLAAEGQGNKQIEQHVTQLAFRQQVVQRNTNLLVMNKSNLDKALYFLEQKEYKKSLEYIELCCEAQPVDEQVRFLKVQILSAMGNALQAAELLKTWLLKEPTNEVWLKTLHLLCRTGLTHQKAVAMLEDVVKHKPKELLPLLYLVDVCTRAHTRDAAIMYYKKALELTLDPMLKTRLYFHMAHVYYEQAKWDEMRNVLEKGYALDANFPPLLNMLAYYYATGSRDLGRAQQLMGKVLATNKTNPHFQDTQALIYYKQQRYDKAVAILEAVVKKVPDDFDILKHLGKTYFKLGKKDKAVTTLERARAVAQSDYEKQKCTHVLGCWIPAS